MGLWKSFWVERLLRAAHMGDDPLWAQLLRQTHLPEEILEAGVDSQGVVDRVYLEGSQTVGVQLIRLFEQRESLIVVSRGDARRNDHQGINGLPLVHL